MCKTQRSGCSTLYLSLLILKIAAAAHGNFSLASLTSPDGVRSAIFFCFRFTSRAAWTPCNSMECAILVLFKHRMPLVARCDGTDIVGHKPRQRDRLAASIYQSAGTGLSRIVMQMVDQEPFVYIRRRVVILQCLSCPEVVTERCYAMAAPDVGQSRMRMQCRHNDGSPHLYQKDRWSRCTYPGGRAVQTPTHTSITQPHKPRIFRVELRRSFVLICLTVRVIALDSCHNVGY
jgi:hypothetical protein